MVIHSFAVCKRRQGQDAFAMSHLAMAHFAMSHSRWPCVGAMTTLLASLPSE